MYTGKQDYGLHLGSSGIPLSVSPPFLGTSAFYIQPQEIKA